MADSYIMDEGSDQIASLFCDLEKRCDAEPSLSPEWVQGQLAAHDRIYADDAGYWIRKGVLYSRKLGDHESAVRYLKRAQVISPGNTAVSFRLAAAYSKSGKRKVSEELYRESERRLMQLYARAGESLVDTTLRLLREEPNLSAAYFASVVLRRQGPQVAAAVLGIMRSTQESERLGFCATALGDLRSADAVPELERRLSYADERVRGACITALGRIRSPESFDGLLAALTDSDPANRSAAAVAIAELGARRAVPALMALLDDATACVVGGAADALGKLGGEGVAEALLRVTEHPSPRVRSSVFRALGAIGDAGCVEALVQHLENDPEKRVRSVSATALGKLGDRRAVAPLTRCLHAANPFARGAAATALGGIGAPEAIPDLERVAATDTPRVRVCAQAALRRIARMGLSPADSKGANR